MIPYKVRIDAHGLTYCAIIFQQLRPAFYNNKKYSHKWKGGLSKQVSQFIVFDSFARLAPRLSGPHGFEPRFTEPPFLSVILKREVNDLSLSFGGEYGARTRDLMTASHARSQLR